MIRHSLVFALTAISLPLLQAQSQPTNNSAIYRSVVRIAVDTINPDYQTPWN